MNFTKKGLQDSANAVKRLTEFRSKLEAACDGPADDVPADHPVLVQFGEALADDLNFSKALSVVLPWAANASEDPAIDLAVLNRVNDVLAVAPLGYDDGGGNDDGLDTVALCKQMDEARASKDWGTADALRTQLQDAGYDVQNSPEGTVAVKRLA